MDNQNAQPRMPQARGRLHQPAQEMQPDFDDVGNGPEKIQKGMPARNIKKYLMLAGGIVVLAVVLMPQKKNQPSVPQPAQIQQPAAPGALVADLEASATTASAQSGTTTAPPPTPAPPDVPATAAQASPTPSLEDERRLAALMASTDGSDVSIRNSSANGTKKPLDDIASIMQAQQERSDQVMRESQAFAQQMAQQMAAANTPSVQGTQPAPQANMGQFNRFLAQQQGAGDAIGPATQLQAQRSNHALYEGTLIRTVLTRALKTDLPGMVTAKVTTDLYDTVTQRVLLIPRGSEITCTYQSELMIGQELVLAACTRLRLPNGKSFSLSAATASDMQGASGLPAEINNHFWKMFKTALVVGAASKLLPSGDQQVSVTNGTSGVSTGGSIIGTALSKIVDVTLSRNISIPPTGRVEIGTPFTLTLSRDVELEPYLR